MSGTDQPQNEENPSIRTLDLRHSAEGTSNIILIIPESVKKVEVAVTVASIVQRNMSRTDLPLQNEENSNESKTMADSRSELDKIATSALYGKAPYVRSFSSITAYPPASAAEVATPTAPTAPTYVWLVTSNHPESTNMPAGIFSDEDRAWDWAHRQHDPKEWKLTPYLLDYADTQRV